MRKFEVIVIGSGPAGMTAGMALKKMGKEVAFVHEDKSMFGGVCLNMGCMPTKSLLKTASVLRQAKHCEKYSLDISVNKVDLVKINKMVENELNILRSSIQDMADNSGATYFYGKGSFKNSHEIIVQLKDGSTETIYGENIVIANGSKPAELPFAKFDGKKILSSDEMLKNTTVPNKLLIIGGGAIGCEFATMYNAFGSEVTIVEALPTLLPKDDADMGNALKDSFIKEKINVKTNTLINSIEIENDVAVVSYEGIDEKEEFDLILVAIGRKPRIDEINLESTGVEVEKGFIKVNDYLQTNIDHIYACGDAIGKLMLVHAADREGVVLAKNLALNSKEVLDELGVPRVVFSYPEAASVGITEENDKIKAFKTYPVPNGRVFVDKTYPAFIKIFVNKESKIIVGASMVGDYMAELIHEFAIAVENKLTVEQLKNVVHAHPSHAANLATAIKQIDL